MTVPASVTVSAGKTTATFTATVARITSNQTAQITASYNGGSKSFSLAVAAAGTAQVRTAQVGTLSCSPATLSAGQTASCTIGLLSPAGGSSSVTIQTSSWIVTAPATVTSSMGQSSIGFQVVSGVAAMQQRVTITASAGTKSVQTSITIQGGSTPTVDAPPLHTVTAAKLVQFKVTQSDPNQLPVSLSVQIYRPEQASIPRPAIFNGRPPRRKPVRSMSPSRRPIAPGYPPARTF